MSLERGQVGRVTLFVVFVHEKVCAEHRWWVRRSGWRWGLGVLNPLDELATGMKPYELTT